MLYRISLDKEDIKFCVAASDKVVPPFMHASLLCRVYSPDRCRCTPHRIPGNEQITALKDHKDKVKPVFLYYKVGLAL